MNDSSKIYEALFEHSPCAILIIEEERFVDCNAAAASMLRFPSKQALLDRYSDGKKKGRYAPIPSSSRLLDNPTRRPRLIRKGG